MRASVSLAAFNRSHSCLTASPSRVFCRKRSEAGAAPPKGCRSPGNAQRSRILSSSFYLDGHRASETSRALWSVTDDTMRNWLKTAICRAADEAVLFLKPDTPHTFRYSYIMHMLYHRQPPNVILSQAGHKDALYGGLHSGICARASRHSARAFYRRRPKCACGATVGVTFPRIRVSNEVLPTYLHETALLTMWS